MRTDRPTSPPGRKLGLGIAAGIVQAAHIVWFGCYFVAYATSVSGQASTAVAFGCMLIGGAIATTVHEIGHAAAAWSCGWRIILFSVRPFALQVPNRNLVWLPRDRKRGTLGMVAAIPRTAGVATRACRAAYLAGGPAASLVLAIVAYAAARALRPFDGEHLWISGLALGLSIQAAGQFLFTLLPLSFTGRPTDGAKLWNLRRPDRIPAPFLWIAVALHYELRLNDLPPWLIAQARAEATGESARWIDGLDAAILLDRKDFAKARCAIDQFRDSYGEDEWLASCDAFLTAIGEENGVAAAGKLWLGDRNPKLSALSGVAEAAVTATLGRREQTEAALRSVRVALRHESPFRNPTFEQAMRDVVAALDRSENAKGPPGTDGPLQNGGRGKD